MYDKGVSHAGASSPGLLCLSLMRAVCVFLTVRKYSSRSQWPRCLKRGSAAARLLGLWVRIVRRHGCLSLVDCCVLSGRGLCDKLTTRSEESYRLCVCLIVCNLETSTMRPPRPELGCCATGKEGKRNISRIDINLVPAKFE
jgi:hypothetical protein